VARRVRPGLEVLLARPGIVRGLRLGLVANPASITGDLHHASRALAGARGARLVALFGPEHGFTSHAQDLVEVGDSRAGAEGLPVYSLYGETRVPSPRMLEGLDAVVVDLQDVGSRYYTYAWTMLHVLEACARKGEGRRVLVLDRPNPLGGAVVAGNVAEPGYESFVGAHPLAVRHGMTMGELALMLREERALDVDLEVVRMRGWQRGMHFEETGLPWVLPSPNIPTVDTAFVYPGGCLVEGTNLSEGRGTTRPFELVGAPWLDGDALARALEGEHLAGAGFRPVAFTPTFQKHAGELCRGVQVHVRDRRRFDAFLTYLFLIHHARRQDPSRFAWREPPYEYELVKPPIDILAGTDRIRRSLEAGRSPGRLVRGWAKPLQAFRRRRQRFLLY
jgi:uncharacterized protein YbbC (DUF1343 family)